MQPRGLGNYQETTQVEMANPTKKPSVNEENSSAHHPEGKRKTGTSWRRTVESKLKAMQQTYG